jgi:hypothetical protein
MDSPAALTRQRGFSSGCFMVSVAFILISAFFAVKLSPSYFEYLNVSNAVDEVIRVDNISSIRAESIMGKMGESIFRNSGANPTELKMSEIVYVRRMNGKRVVGFNYEVVISLFYNVSALIHYKYERTSGSGG